LILILLSITMFLVGRGLLPLMFGVAAGIIDGRSRQKGFENFTSETIKSLQS
jgi:hypothetical protein